MIIFLYIFLLENITKKDEYRSSSSPLFTTAQQY